MSSRITTSLLAAAVAAAAITPATAHAYRTYADDPEVRYPARWYSSSQVWQLSSAGLAASGLSDSQALETLRSAFTTLSGPTCEHALPEITVSGVGGAARADDGTNTIDFVSDWSSRGLPPSSRPCASTYADGSECRSGARVLVGPPLCCASGDCSDGSSRRRGSSVPLVRGGAVAKCLLAECVRGHVRRAVSSALPEGPGSRALSVRRSPDHLADVDVRRLC